MHKYPVSRSEVEGLTNWMHALLKTPQAVFPMYLQSINDNSRLVRRSREFRISRKLLLGLNPESSKCGVMSNSLLRCLGQIKGEWRNTPTMLVLMWSSQDNWVHYHILINPLNVIFDDLDKSFLLWPYNYSCFVGEFVKTKQFGGFRWSFIMGMEMRSASFPPISLDC